MELCVALLCKQMSLADIGRVLGNVSVAALTQNRKRLLTRMQDDIELANLVYGLKQDLAED